MTAKTHPATEGYQPVLEEASVELAEKWQSGAGAAASAAFQAVASSDR